MSLGWLERTSEECDSSESGKGGYSRCVFIVHHHVCWIIERKNSLWSMLCSPHTNLLPVSLPESHSFFKCLQAGCSAMLFFPAKDISNPLCALNWYVSDMLFSEYKKYFLDLRFDSRFTPESSEIKRSWTLLRAFLSMQTLKMNDVR